MKHSSGSVQKIMNAKSFPVDVYPSCGAFVAACKAAGCYGSGVDEESAKSALRMALKAKFGKDAPEA